MSWFKSSSPQKTPFKVPVSYSSRRVDEKVADAIKALTEALEQKRKKK